MVPLLVNSTSSLYITWRETVGARDAVADLDHGAHVGNGDLVLRTSDLLLENVYDFSRANCHP